MNLRKKQCNLHYYVIKVTKDNDFIIQNVYEGESIMKYEDFDEKMKNHSTKIVLDTNVILDLARYSLHTTKNILSIFEECKDYIWIPNQVFKEYSKNKYKIFGDLKKRYSQFENSLLTILNDFERKLERALIISYKYKYVGTESLSDNIKKKSKEYREIIESYKESLGKEYEVITLGSPDIIKEIEDFVNKLDKNKKIGKKIGFKEQMEIINEGEFRYKYNIAPGYRDNDKEGIEKFGDLFIWKEILKLPTIDDNVQNIIFITGDVKDDWWSKDQQGNIEVKGELLSEFSEVNPNVNFNMMTLAMFQEYASKLYDLTEYAVFVDLNRNDESFIERVESEISKEIINDIEDDIYSYIDSVDLGSESIDGIEIDDCSLLNIITIDPYLDDNNYVIYYELEYKITLLCNSYEYWGRDDETKEIITSPPIEHKFSGNVVVSIKRVIPLDKFKSNFKHDFLNNDTDYEEFEIIDSDIEQTYVNKDIYRNEDYE